MNAVREESERHLVGAMMIAPLLFPTAAVKIRPWDFSCPEARLAWEAMEAVYDKFLTLETINVVREFRELGGSCVFLLEAGNNAVSELCRTNGQMMDAVRGWMSEMCSK
jgi:hypothetical protein